MSQHPSVSKFHAVIDFDDGNRAFLRDNSSLNHTYLNGVKLESQKNYGLKTGDKVRFGFDSHEYTFLNFGLLETRNKDLDRTVGGEIESQFIEENRLYELKNVPKPTAAQLRQAKATGQSELEITMQALIEKLETEAYLVNQKIELQMKQIDKTRAELDGVADRRKSFEQDREVSSTKQQALEKYIIDLQKKYSELERAIDDKEDQLAELCDREWARNLEHLRAEQRLLERFVLEKQGELVSIQKYTASLFHQSNGSPNVHLLEEQSRELALTKRLLIERENRNNECTRKWKDLYDVSK